MHDMLGNIFTFLLKWFNAIMDRNFNEKVERPGAWLDWTLAHLQEETLQTRNSILAVLRQQAHAAFQLEALVHTP